MIIGIDISSVVYQTGVSNYTLNLVRNLIEIDRKNTYKLFFSSLRQPLPSEIKALENFSNVKIYHFRLPPTLLEILWNQLHILPIESFIGDCDIFHTSDWTQPPTVKAKAVATIHDLTPFLNPAWHHPKIINAHTRKMNLAAKECSQFICVSKNTKKDLLELFPKIDTNKITVIYEAAESKYEDFLKETIEKQNEEILKVKKKYKLTDFILAQGTREPRKNLNNLISAFNKFKLKNPKSNIELAIAGKYGWGNDIENSKKSDIKILGFIPENDLVALHAAAVCLVYPSLYEGFGLPVLKSMQIGTPVITSNVSSLPEITKDSAILINPISVDEIANAIENMVNSGSLRTELRNKGILRSKDFSWRKAAEETLKIYESIKN
jgi:glycosyltransferase involved in cell wall biosynthesis